MYIMRSPAVIRQISRFADLLYIFLALKPSIQCTTLVLLSGFIFGQFGVLYETMTLHPINIFQLHLWRPLTSIFIETNFVVFVYSLFAFQQFIHLIVPNWSIEETTKYFAIVQLITTFTIVIFSFFFVLIGYWDFFYYSSIYGSSSLVMASLIAIKQFLPDTVIFSSPFGRLKMAHLPFASICASLFLWLISLLRGTIFLQLIFSLETSWVYLRYFQPHSENDGILGDEGENFTWASLFPKKAQPLATIIGRLTFRILRRSGIFKKQIIQMEDFEVLESVKTGFAVPTESMDSERKRQKALRMLNERLNSTPSLQLNKPDFVTIPEEVTQKVEELFEELKPKEELLLTSNDESGYHHAVDVNDR